MHNLTAHQDEMRAQLPPIKPDLQAPALRHKVFIIELSGFVMSDNPLLALRNIHRYPPSVSKNVLCSIYEHSVVADSMQAFHGTF